jgi:hypothetical protein
MEQEAQILALVKETGAEPVALPRYMQTLSEGRAAKLAGRCIHIHHSFLHGFKGASPYPQAHARGVKAIGATAHYVTHDLDEGPIIEQVVERISHHRPEDPVQKDRDIERRVLARAVRDPVENRVENRVAIDGSKSIVLPDLRRRPQPPRRVAAAARTPRMPGPRPRHRAADQPRGVDSAPIQRDWTRDRPRPTDAARSNPRFQASKRKPPSKS